MQRGFLKGWAVVLGVAVSAVLAATVWATSVATTLNPGFGSVELSGVAGGSVHALEYGRSNEGLCKGWISDQANHVLTLSEAMNTMLLRIDAPDDTTLVVVGPDRVRCVDDHGDDHNPQLHGPWPAGTYRVFVGTYQEGRQAHYRLSIREQAPRHAIPRGR